MTINQKEAVDSRRTFAIISHPDLGKQRLLNNYYYLGAPSAKLEQSKGKKQGTLPNLTGWKLKNNGEFR